MLYNDLLFEIRRSLEFSTNSVWGNDDHIESIVKASWKDLASVFEEHKPVDCFITAKLTAPDLKRERWEMSHQRVGASVGLAFGQSRE